MLPCAHSSFGSMAYLKHLEREREIERFHVSYMLVIHCVHVLEALESMFISVHYCIAMFCRMHQSGY